MKILLSLLEYSANLHAQKIINELQKKQKLELFGIYDFKEGALYKSSEFNAMGFVEILPLIFKAKKAIKQMVELAKNVDLVLLVDSPAFNIPLAKALKKAKVKVKVVYYILPQVWAWKEYRAKIVSQNCDKLISIWPFESKFYENCIYAGHPLLDEIKVEKTLQKTNKVVFMPGSRKAEISYLMPEFLAIAPKIEAKKFIVVPPHFKGQEKQIYGDIKEFSFVYDANLALSEADFAFICSGTATLQAALIGTPFVLCYKAKAIDIFLARIFVKNLKHIGLANIVFDFLQKDELHAELIQEKVTPSALLQAFNDYDINKFTKAAKDLKEYLKCGASKNLAKILMDCLK